MHKSIFVPMDYDQNKPPLGHLLSQTSRLMLTLLHRNFRKAGYHLSPEQWIILLNLWHANGNPMSQHTIGIRTGKDKASITRLVQSLETAGLVTRKPDPLDARIRLVLATAKGHKLEQAATKVLIETTQQTEGEMSSEELDTLRGLLMRISNNTRQAMGSKESTDPDLDLFISH
jgi:DNA-binding MarR family transcriptional regulator